MIRIILLHRGNGHIEIFFERIHYKINTTLWGIALGKILFKLILSCGFSTGKDHVHYLAFATIKGWFVAYEIAD